MENEGYEIEEFVCPYFKELIYEGNVVGFYTYEYVIDAFKKCMCINEFYVVPEYRNNKIFINTLKNLIVYSEYDGI